MTGNGKLEVEWIDLEMLLRRIRELDEELVSLKEYRPEPIYPPVPQDWLNEDDVRLITRLERLL